MKWGFFVFYIQDGQFSQSLTTHEAILTAASGVHNITDYGAGVFAFATSGGSALLFEDQVFNIFLSNNRFTLIVGMDDITNTIALNKLKELRERHEPNLEVKVFYHNDSGSLFHPKFIWFKIDDEIRLLTGSGNLTQKGLRQNKEAFTVNVLKEEDLNNFENYWNLWISENNGNLCDLEDPKVVNKAAINATRFTKSYSSETELDILEEENAPIEIPAETVALESEESLGNKPLSITEIVEKEDDEAWSIVENSEVLVAEIPNSGNRWRQANFKRDVFENFFGGIAGGTEERRILLKSINDTGQLEDLEVRRAVSVKSQNYRVELHAGRGLDYPEGDNRPIGIFIKVSSTRSFIYSLVMPQDVAYNEVLTYLDNNGPRKRHMRRYLTDVEKLRENCPSLSFWMTSKIGE